MKQRNFGLDLLRMAAMFLVAVLHVLGAGGVLDSAAPLGMMPRSASIASDRQVRSRSTSSR